MHPPNKSLRTLEVAVFGPMTKPTPFNNKVISIQSSLPHTFNLNLLVEVTYFSQKQKIHSLETHLLQPLRTSKPIVMCRNLVLRNFVVLVCMAKVLMFGFAPREEAAYESIIFDRDSDDLWNRCGTAGATDATTTARFSPSNKSRKCVGR
jgi:hypothetical protein